MVLFFIEAARMDPLQGQVQPELPCPLSCGSLDTSKAKIDEMPERYIGVIRAARRKVGRERGRDVQCRLFCNS
jgi:hypothetical protein